MPGQRSRAVTAELAAAVSAMVATDAERVLMRSMTVDFSKIDIVI